MKNLILYSNFISRISSWFIVEEDQFPDPFFVPLSLDCTNTWTSNILVFRIPELLRIWFKLTFIPPPTPPVNFILVGLWHITLMFSGNYSGPLTVGFGNSALPHVRQMVHDLPFCLWNFFVIPQFYHALLVEIDPCAKELPKLFEKWNKKWELLTRATRSLFKVQQRSLF